MFGAARIDDAPVDPSIIMQQFPPSDPARWQPGPNDPASWARYRYGMDPTPWAPWRAAGDVSEGLQRAGILQNPLHPDPSLAPASSGTPPAGNWYDSIIAALEADEAAASDWVKSWLPQVPWGWLALGVGAVVFVPL